MKRSLYYKTVDQGKNSIIDAIVGFMSALAFFPRILLEVFIRKNFGERYFKLSSPIFLILVLIWIPYFKEAAHTMGYFGGSSVSIISVVTGNLTWYLFLAGFAYCSFLRKSEIAVSKNKYDFTKYSLYSGDNHPLLMKYAKKKEVIDGVEQDILDQRKLETIIEPAIFLLIGLVLTLFAQIVGVLILLCSIVYSLSYVSDWRRGDNFVLSIIDEIIAAENMHKAFVEDRDPSETQNFRTRGDKPKSRAYKQKIADETIFDDDENPHFAL